jgi:hypothetical protein
MNTRHFKILTGLANLLFGLLVAAAPVHAATSTPHVRGVGGSTTPAKASCTSLKAKIAASKIAAADKALITSKINACLADVPKIETQIKAAKSLDEVNSLLKAISSGQVYPEIYYLAHTTLVSATSMTQCVNVYVPAHFQANVPDANVAAANLANLRNSTIGGLNLRISEIKTLQKAVDADKYLNKQQKASLTSAFASDTADFGNMLAATTPTTPVDQLTQTWCKTIFNYYVFSLRKNQVGAVRQADKWAQFEADPQGPVKKRADAVIAAARKSKDKKAAATAIRQVEAVRSGPIQDIVNQARSVADQALAANVSTINKNPDYFKPLFAKIAPQGDFAQQNQRISSQLAAIKSALDQATNLPVARVVGRKAMPGDNVQIGNTYIGPASTYGNDPVTHYADPGDNNIPALSGASNNNPGIAIYNHGTLGGWWLVKAPNGIKAVIQQTDIGPSATPSIDINAVAARTIFHLPQGNSFPTDQGNWTMEYLGKKKPSGL